MAVTEKARCHMNRDEAELQSEVMRVFTVS